MFIVVPQGSCPVYGQPIVPVVVRPVRAWTRCDLGMACHARMEAREAVDPHERDGRVAAHRTGLRLPGVVPADGRL